MTPQLQDGKLTIYGMALDAKTGAIVSNHGNAYTTAPPVASR